MRFGYVILREDTFYNYDSVDKEIEIKWNSNIYKIMKCEKTNSQAEQIYKDKQASTT